MDSKTNNIRVLAISAHEHAAGTIASHKLYSSDPASLYNAMRKAAWLADYPYDPNKPGEKSIWVHSNLSSYVQEDRRGTFPISKEIAHRRSKLLLMHSSEQLDVFRERLKAEKPNILFIGAMTLAMPGAIECAKVAHEELGDKVLIVLGGYHVSETMYIEKKKEKKDKDEHEEAGQEFVNITRRGEEAPPVITHHSGSPLLLMRKGEKDGGIPPLFDLVVAGRSEELIPEIGEIAGKCLQRTGSVLKFKEYLKQRKDIRNVPGNWILGYLEDGEMRTITGRGKEIDYNDMPSPSKVFGVHTAFDVFEGRPTAHVFSDTGGGCSKDCHFCSERASSRGKLIDMAHAPDRLYKQMCDAATVIYEQYGRKKLPSAFVEDSILLGGSLDKINRFCKLMEYGRDVNECGISNMIFGAQLTVDDIVNNPDLIKRLKNVGLDYVFIGIETENMEGVSKATLGGARSESKGKSWMERVEIALRILHNNHIKSGCALLFGGSRNDGSVETQEERLALLDKIAQFQEIGRAPGQTDDVLIKVSSNWATCHPNYGEDGGANYTYKDWGTPADHPLREGFENFGEASVKYTMPGGPPLPSKTELDELVARTIELNSHCPPIVYLEPVGFSAARFTEGIKHR